MPSRNTTPKVDLNAKGAIDTILTDRPLAYHPVLAKILRSTTAGIFISQILYWTPRSRNEDRWIYKTQDEVFEETGYHTEVIKLAAIKDRGMHPYKPVYPHHIYKLFFLCKLTGGVPTENLEAAKVEFFDIDALPSLSESRTLTEDIVLLHRHMESLELPTYCD